MIPTMTRTKKNVWDLVCLFVCFCNQKMQGRGLIHEKKTSSNNISPEEKAATTTRNTPLTVQPLTISQRTQTRTTAGQRLQTELGFGGFLVQGQVGGQYIRNRLKIAKKRRLYLDIFSCVKINVFRSFFAFRLEMHVRCDNRYKT